MHFMTSDTIFYCHRIASPKDVKHSFNVITFSSYFSDIENFFIDYNISKLSIEHFHLQLCLKVFASFLQMEIQTCWYM